MGHGYPVKLGRVNRVPKYGVAEIAPEKLTKYILDPENETGKWRLFKAIGYDLDNPQDLERDLRRGLRENDAEASIKSAKGEKTYVVTMELGIGTTSRIDTVWQTDNDDAPPRFITAYKAKKRRA